MGDRYSTGLFWVLELFMVPPGSDLVPTILLEFFYDFPAVHVYNVYTLDRLGQEKYTMYIQKMRVCCSAFSGARPSPRLDPGPV